MDKDPEDWGRIPPIHQKNDRPVSVNYTSSNGKKGLRIFPTHNQATWWIYNEGDHLIDYNVNFSA